MKRLLVLLLALSLTLCSCNGATGNKQNTDKTNPPEVAVTTSYEDIERREATSYQTNYYGFKKDSAILKIKHPKEWSLSEIDRGFELIRDGETIGYLIRSTADDAVDWTVLETESHSVNDVKVTKYIEQKNGDTAFRYRYVYNYSTDNRTRTLTLTAACAEIDQRSEEKLYSEVVMVDKIASETVGSLSNYINDKEYPTILILGNSFISSSHIGSILKEMFKNGEKNCYVEAISKGYASVETYANSPLYPLLIREGAYDVVFLCGFYSQAEIAHVATLKQACDQSSTPLVLFPAHNEGADIVASAQKQYSINCLNWKGELDGLIKDGVNRLALCEDDLHGHSKPLAGYVGAHMIYRALYNEMPAPMQELMDQTYIDSVLGDYAYVGDAYIIDDDKITYLD